MDRARDSSLMGITYAGGIITCAHCGRAVTGEHKIKKSPDGTRRDYFYYRCSGYCSQGHPKTRLNQGQIDQQLLAFFATIKLDTETRQWFVDVIKARAKAGQVNNKQNKIELRRQHDSIETKLQSLLDLRIEGSIGQDEFVAKRLELQDRQAAVRLQLECSDRDNDAVADLAIKAFEFSQTLTERWFTADYNAKRTILSIMLETVRLNSGNLELNQAIGPEKSL